jgi:polar amino acid transport system permease protein
LIGFVLLLALAGTGFLGLALSFRKNGNPRFIWLGKVCLVGHAALILLLAAQPALIEIFLNSAVANSVDPFESSIIQATVRPRVLTPEALIWITGLFQQFLLIYAVGFVVAAAIGFGSQNITLNRVRHLVMMLQLIAAGYLLFIVHAGFASGLFITLRAAIFAYIAAAILGLCWAGLQGLTPGPNTFLKYALVSLALAGSSAYFFMQPADTFVLVGSLEKRVAIIKGTPQSLTDTIRYGEYDGATHEAVKIRSVATVEDALKALALGTSVTAVFVPQDTDTADNPILWEISFLPNDDRVPAMSLAVMAFLLGFMTFSGWQHKNHPLSVGAEFFIDTIRGIPMLVIILYVGLPLSGAVKDASGGVIDLPNMTRGIIAISIGYSAYMAEIFRAGIEAIPRGQIEAAQSMGLSRWHVARLVVLPQALRIVIPPLGNEFIAMLKDSSLLSILSIRDITQRMREFQAASFLPFAPFNTAAILYVGLTLASASMLKWIERRYERKSH